MYSKVKGYIDNFADYFPGYDESYIPPRKYFCNIFSTLYQELTEMFIDNSIKDRNLQKVTQESKIEISEVIINQIKKILLLKTESKSTLYACCTQRSI